MTHHPYVPPPQAPRPGALPLRFLGLGDYFEGLFRVIGRGPMATLLLPIVTQTVGTVAVLLGMGVVFSDVLFFMSSGLDSTPPPVPTPGQLFGGLAVFLIGLAVAFLGQVAASGFSTITTVRAATNQRTSLADAWSLFRPRTGRFLGLYLLILYPIGIAFFLAGTAIVTGWFMLLFRALENGIAGGGLWVLPLVGFALLAVGIWLGIKLSAAPSALAAEDISATEAIRRSWRLTRAQWWRVLGIQLLFGLLISAITAALTTPIEVVTGFSDFWTGEAAFTALVFTGLVVSSVITAGGSALQLVVTATIYTDLRFRKDQLHEAIRADLAAGRVQPLPRAERPDGTA
ncbi:glycerophosphoryl diester phosphodiesterase membrane domain-containing protein [Zhihengliuella salsuginis]|uniref:DUF7847 domain-containing protein n=1 Tax=Zhihengliuella salsuginis TaxID=578222 RepID=A0ABQ3GC07_9MICC|nr:glycerophosphoryl diester phosphodiesterase membrane domain-containing protein [Zhihengliuella salsuginis]GHD00847.1 hypothetical protein GCM10008096_04250 [Zhihengliuella salsuginis]